VTYTSVLVIAERKVSRTSGGH